MLTLAEVEEHRQAVAALVTLARRQLAAVWQRLDLQDVDATTAALRPVLYELMGTYGTAAASLGADWYEDVREVAGAAGRFTASLVELPDQGRTDSLVRWGTRPLVPQEMPDVDEYEFEPDPDAALSRIDGGLQRIIADADRDTIEENIDADPARPLFARHASANACAFCALLATRGAVYRSETSALRVVGRGTEIKPSRPGERKRGRPAKGIRARGERPLGSKYHDHCHCTAVPVFEGNELEEAPYVAKWREAYANAPVNPGKAIDLKDTLASMREQLGTN